MGEQPWLREPLASNSPARLRAMAAKPDVLGALGTRCGSEQSQDATTLQRNPNEGEHEPTWLPGGVL